MSRQTRVLTLSVLAALLALTALPTPVRGQGFEALILPRPSALNQVEGTGISPDGVVAGYGWEVDDTSPSRGLRWTPDFDYRDVEAPQMNGHLTSVVFNGIDPRHQLAVRGGPRCGHR